MMAVRAGGRRAAGVLAAFVSLFLAGVGQAAEVSPALDRNAHSALLAILDEDRTWVRIHAAEALIAGGAGPAMHAYFLPLADGGERVPYRVGVYRVLARTAPTAAERARWVDAVEHIFLDLQAPDRSQAIETLDKLRVVPTAECLALVRRTADEGPRLLQPLALWSLRLAGAPDALPKLCALLASPDATMRLDAAYAFRLLGEKDPLALHALADAVAVEKPTSKAYPYVLSAAFALNAAPGRAKSLRHALESLRDTGSADTRFEVCQALLPSMTEADLPSYRVLLESPDADTRVGAGLTILTIARRPVPPVRREAAEGGRAPVAP